MGPRIDSNLGQSPLAYASPLGLHPRWAYLSSVQRADGHDFGEQPGQSW